MLNPVGSCEFHAVACYINIDCTCKAGYSMFLPNMPMIRVTISLFYLIFVYCNTLHSFWGWHKTETQQHISSIHQFHVHRSHLEINVPMHQQLQGQLFDRPSRLGQKTKPPKYQPNPKGQTSTIAVPFLCGWLSSCYLINWSRELPFPPYPLFWMVKPGWLKSGLAQGTHGWIACEAADGHSHCLHGRMDSNLLVL